MSNQVAIVIDCGSTNITVLAVDPTGKIIAGASRPNEAVPQPKSPQGWMIWDLEALFGRISACCQELMPKLTKAEELGVPILDEAGFEHLLATGELPAVG